MSAWGCVVVVVVGYLAWRFMAGFLSAWWEDEGRTRWEEERRR